MKVITLRIDDALAEQLKTLAWEQHTSMNKLLARLVVAAVNPVQVQTAGGPIFTQHESGYTEASDGDLADAT